MKKTIIISGGNINYDFALEFLKNNPADSIIGADRGIEFLKKTGIKPDYIVGDFDSANQQALDYFKKLNVKVIRFQPEKDDTDTRIAVELAIREGSTSIYIIGGTGTRIDHVLGNIQNLSLAMQNGIECYLIDPNNRIRLVNRETILSKSEQYGEYISLISHTSEVTGLTLRGFYYPLTNYTMTCSHAIGISNEIVEEKAVISFDSGCLIVVESRD